MTSHEQAALDAACIYKADTAAVVNYATPLDDSERDLAEEAANRMVARATAIELKTQAAFDRELRKSSVRRTA